MYKTIEETAEYLELSIDTVLRLVRQKQIRFVVVGEEILINSNQFELFLKERKKQLEEYQRYLDEPIPEDIDVKDED